ncbi:hypothetical protein EXIGLDRAFT_750024 [Exidia glandulosa HHB12029]|uniref:GST N-terminal domain-containing protein n=1 Tax=Exidia glandulosa HHB12029 TaxID=1314781 RepID=A0A165H9U1_EXIGL|nr:hypothetical protein EXIGLDRAFT_750024 [Exidia glandulosa HHB12029]
MSKDAAITFYDIPSSRGAWSPNTWRARFVLNLKKIPYTTHWLNYPEIEPFMKSIGAKPTDKKPAPDDNEDWYTCPVLSVDGKIIEDSLAIIDYLETAYPDTPRVYPHGTKALQLAFGKWWLANIFMPSLRILLPGVPPILDPAGAEYFHSSRARWYGQPLPEWTPAGSDERAKVWQATKEGLAKASELYTKREDTTSVWLTGATPVYADIVALSWLAFIKAAVTEKEWEELRTWDDGFWGKLWDASAPYRSEQ